MQFSKLFSIQSYPFFHEQFTVYRRAPLISSDYLILVDKRSRVYQFSMTFLIIALALPIILTSYSSYKTSSKIPLTANSYQEEDYTFIWDEFNDAPGDIPGDDILEFGPSFGNFHNYTEIISKLSALESTFPNYCEVFTIGKTHLNHEIYGIKLTDESFSNSKEEILIVAQHHARELITVENALYFADRLIFDARQQDLKALSTLRTREIYIIPSLNIDGTLLISLNPWQRKTTGGMDLPKNQLSFENLEVEDVDENGYIDIYLENIDGTIDFPFSYEGIDLNNDSEIGDTLKKGVDPNRNYDYGFGNEPKASSNPISFGYSGNRAFSEECTLRLKRFIRKHNFKTAVSLHSGIQAIYYPFISKIDAKETFDGENYQNVTKKLQMKLGFKAAPMVYNGGLFSEWMYWRNNENRLAYCLETYGNKSAVKLEFNKSTGLYREYGIWDFFNPPSNQVIDNSVLIYEGLDYLVNYNNPEPKNTTPVLVIVCGSIGIVGLGLFIIRKNKWSLRRNPIE